VPEPLVLTAAQLKELQRTARRSAGWVCERIHYVRLFARGYDPAEIAELYQVDVRTVETWLERYREGGVGALADHPRSGRPRLARAAAHAEATRCLEQNPEPAAVGRTTWTRALLGRHLAERVGCFLSGSSVARLIARLGFVWRRPKLTVKGSDPQAEPKKAAIQAAIAAYPTAPRLYGDECDVHQVPVVRGQYQRKGEQREIPTPGTNCKQAVFGFLNVLTGAWHYWLTPSKRSGDFLSCLHELYRLYPVGPILLFLDGASIHKSKVTRRWLANHPRLRVYYLPGYSGHKTNPVEKVWGALKDEYFADVMHASREAVQDAIHAFFASFSRARALQLTRSLARDTAAAGVPLQPLALAA
jgi:transposase